MDNLDSLGNKRADSGPPEGARPVAAAVKAASVLGPNPSNASFPTIRATAIAPQPGIPQTLAHANAVEPSTEQPTIGRKRRWMPASVPSWLISLMFHVALILVLAAITLDPVQTVISILNASTGSDSAAISEFDLASPSLDDASVSTETALAPETPTFDSSQTLTSLEAPQLDTPSSLIASLDGNIMTESILPTNVLGGGGALAQVASSLNSRSGASKSELLERFGGNAASEKAVAMALKWIAEHQAQDGGWTFQHTLVCNNRDCPDHGELAEARNGATAMAILPFLGAGQTHMEGQYQQTVKRGLAFLINNMEVTRGALPVGSWWEDGGRMYSHGLAAIAICEAYAMTSDPDLLQPAQLAINYLVFAQDPQGGGWRYRPQQSGDTSVVGWCIMALKSGKMGHLVVPPTSLQRAEYFLDFVSSNDGAYYGYNQPTKEPRRATSAVGLLCRMYMGWKKDDPGLQAGIAYLSKEGPKTNDLYYSYYATQVMRHYGGPAWEKWNREMRDPLIKQQVTQGHAAGSWYTGGSHASRGGRLMATSLATMMLEVYYRHMPLYQEKTSEDDFEI